MGTHEGQLSWSSERLSLQAIAVAEKENQALIDVGLGPTGKFLDVGCGNGAAAARIQNAFPRLRVQGVELVETLAQEAKTKLGAENILAAPDHRIDWAALGSFDYLHARLVLRHVPDAESFVKNMAGAAAPGGRVIMVDADDQTLQTSPEIPGLLDTLNKLHGLARKNGADPHVGQRLAELARAAGLVELRTRAISMSTRDLDLLNKNSGRHNFMQILSFLWRDPKSGEHVDPALAHEAERWIDTHGAFGTWSLIVVSGKKPT